GFSLLFNIFNSYLLLSLLISIVCYDLSLYLTNIIMKYYKIENNDPNEMSRLIFPNDLKNMNYHLSGKQIVIMKKISFCFLYILSFGYYCLHNIQQMPAIIHGIIEMYS